MDDGSVDDVSQNGLLRPVIAVVAHRLRHLRCRRATSYADFAYLSFTLGMTYQVSDMVIRDPRIRRTALVHSLFSYVFGVVIVSTGVNIVAGLAG
jgi:uncharacterized membrane protein